MAREFNKDRFSNNQHTENTMGAPLETGSANRWGIFSFHGPRKAVPIHPKALNSTEYIIDKRRRCGDDMVWVPADAHLEGGACVVYFPKLSWLRYHARVLVIKPIAIFALAVLAYFTIEKSDIPVTISEITGIDLPALYMGAIVALSLILWLALAALSRALDQHLPCCFLTEKAFFYKAEGLYADTHSAALLVSVASTDRTWRSDRIRFKAHGCSEQESALIRGPSKFAQTLKSNFVQPNANVFPELEKPQNPDVDFLRAA